MGRPRREIGGDARELVAEYGGIRQAAAATGVPYGTLYRRYKEGSREPVAGPDELEYPTLPSSELSAEELIDQACARFSRHLAARDARRWYEIKIKSDRPIGLCCVGDPHIDDKGTNWPLLRSHIKILRETEGMYALGGHDITNNWVGRLVRLYADAEVSKTQAWKLAAWLLRDAGVRWMAVVLGNHDLWNDGAALIKANAQIGVPVDEWQARIQLGFPNGRKVRIHCAHDFPGQSQFNQLHGAQKMALWGDPADIYMCAHKHSWALTQGEQPHTGNLYWLARSRGYKEIDDYAQQLGFGSQRYGASITAVIDPGAEGPKRIQCFAELEEAAEFLTWLRGRA